jgi:hypothetical protein
MEFRFGLKLEDEAGNLRPAPFIPNLSDFSMRQWAMGKAIGDMAAYYEGGDFSYSLTWMIHRRWDRPESLAPNSVVQIIYNRILYCPEYLEARLQNVGRGIINRLALTEWDLFKTPLDRPKKWFGLLGDILKEPETGYYLGLQTQSLVSTRMALYLVMADGGLRGRHVRYREMMYRLGLADVKGAQNVRPDEVSTLLLEGTILQLPDLTDILKKLPLMQAPRIIHEGGLIGGAIGTIVGIGGWIVNPFATMAVIVPPALLGLGTGVAFPWFFYSTTREACLRYLTANRVLCDCVWKPEQMVEAYGKELSERMKGFIP